jgi:hypothetical protein
MAIPGTSFLQVIHRQLPSTGSYTLYGLKGITKSPLFIFLFSLNGSGEKKISFSLLFKGGRTKEGCVWVWV